MVEKKPVSNVNGWLLLAGCGQRVEKMEIKSEWGSSIEENEVQNPQKSSSCWARPVSHHFSFSINQVDKKSSCAISITVHTFLYKELILLCGDAIRAQTIRKLDVKTFWDTHKNNPLLLDQKEFL